MHEYSGIDAVNIGPVGHGIPPLPFYVVFELNTDRAVIPACVDTTVDFAALKNESPPFAKRYKCLHVFKIRRLCCCLVFGHRQKLTRTGARSQIYRRWIWYINQHLDRLDARS